MILSNANRPVKKILPALFLAFLVFALYSPALRNGFVWDDTALILRDPLIRSWRLIPEGFQHFLFIDATASDFYRPIQRLTYTLDYAAFIFRPPGYHLTSIIWHIAAALALLLLSAEFLHWFDVEERKRRRLAFLVTLIWAVHPVHTAAVVYVSGRADPLAAAFGFLGLYCAIRFCRTNGRNRWIFLLATAALFLLSALSKESGLIFLLLWLTLLALRKHWKELIPASVAALFVIVVYLSLRLAAEHVPPPTLHAPAPLLVRPIIAARAFAEYTGLILLPLNLHMDRDVETQPEGSPEARLNSAAWRELQTLAGILLLAAGYWLARARQDPAVAAGLVLAAIAYLPVSGLFPLNATIAEHWIYLPTAFLFLAGGLALSRLIISPRILGMLLIAWLVFLGARTCVRTFDWKDQRTFLERTIAHGTVSVRMLVNLAGVELREGQLDSAKQHLQLALRKEPEQPLAVLNLAAVALRQKDFANARDLLHRAINLPLVDASAHEMLGLVEFQENGRVDLMRFRLASRTGPSNWEIEKRYVKVLDQSGATDAAIAELKACLATQWYRADSWQLLSELCAKQGHIPEAAKAKARAEDYDVHLRQQSNPR